jgi:tetratricopeptide (TPR) repeat protein
VKVKPVAMDHSVEWLKYEFADEQPSSAVVQLQWEKLMIPFRIDVDVVGTQIASFQKELRSDKGFTWESWNQAALYCAQNKTNLGEALLWADSATNVDFGGSQTFQAWSTKASVLDSLGRSQEAEAAMKKALPYGSVNDLYFYGRTLTRAHKGKEALEIFKMNYDKHPDEFLTNVGMARGYSAIGNYKKALVYAQKAQPQAVGPFNVNVMATMLKKLQSGQDVN